MINFTIKFKEIVLFCLIYSCSFVLMGEVVKTVNPITSTFITYGLTALFFIVLNLKSLKKLTLIITNNKKQFIIINTTTLVNTVLAFAVMQYISPLIYVVVFFGSLPLIKDLSCFGRKKICTNSPKISILIFFSSILIGEMISSRSIESTMLGMGGTVISSYFAVKYMQTTEILHKTCNLSSSQVLSLRFFFVIFICGGYSLFNINTLRITEHDLILLIITSMTGSIIPLFLMQRSIVKLGASITSKVMSIVPVLCMIFLALMGLEYFTKLNIVAIILFSILLSTQIKNK